MFSHGVVPDNLSSLGALPRHLGFCQALSPATGTQAGGRRDTPAYLLRQLRPGQAVEGPAMLIDDISTVVVEPRCTARITAGGDIRIDVGGEASGPQRSLEEADPIQLAIFSHRHVGTRLSVLRLVVTPCLLGFALLLALSTAVVRLHTCKVLPSLQLHSRPRLRGCTEAS